MEISWYRWKKHLFFQENQSKLLVSLMCILCLYRSINRYSTSFVSAGDVSTKDQPDQFHWETNGLGLFILINVLIDLKR